MRNIGETTDQCRFRHRTPFNQEPDCMQHAQPGEILPEWNLYFIFKQMHKPAF